MGEEKKMKRDIKIVPSVLSFDFQNIQKDLKRMKDAGLWTLHYDVMDGHFVRNVSFGETLYPSWVPEGFEGEVHLMMTNPLLHTKFFFQLGASTVLVHYEVIKDYVEGFLKAEEEWRKGKRLGIVVSPDTPLENVYPCLGRFDVVMVMTVFPGAAGQPFIPEGLERVIAVRKYLDSHKLKTLLEVDGGINAETGPKVANAGADILVSGAYLAKATNLEEAKRSLLGISSSSKR